MKLIKILLFLIAFDLCAYKIVGLVPARNEEVIIAQCLRCLSLFTDAIVFLDDASTDKTVEIVENLAKECRIERIIRKGQWHRDEPGDRNKLLNAGREIEGTHFIVIDADEILTSNFLKENFLRNLILALGRGDKLCLKWIQLWRSPDKYRDDDSVWSNSYVDCIFCDDGKCSYASEFIHTPRSPSNLSGGTFQYTTHKFGLLHFQFVNWKNLLIKQSWYRCLERIRFPKKQIKKINTMYADSKNENGLRRAVSDPEWYNSYNGFKKEIYFEPEKWRSQQILSWFKQYGRAFFKGLDIWDINWAAN